MKTGITGKGIIIMLIITFIIFILAIFVGGKNGGSVNADLISMTQTGVKLDILLILLWGIEKTYTYIINFFKKDPFVNKIEPKDSDFSDLK